MCSPWYLGLNCFRSEPVSFRIILKKTQTGGGESNQHQSAGRPALITPVYRDYIESPRRIRFDLYRLWHQGKAFSRTSMSTVRHIVFPWWKAHFLEHQSSPLRHTGVYSCLVTIVSTPALDDRERHAKSFQLVLLAVSSSKNRSNTPSVSSHSHRLTTSAPMSSPSFRRVLSLVLWVVRPYQVSRLSHPHGPH